MDISRSVLDNLMGRDRNLPKDSIHSRDHYSNSDVLSLPTRSVNLFLSVSVSTHFFPTLSSIKDHVVNVMTPISKLCLIMTLIEESMNESTSRNVSVFFTLS